MKSVFSTYLLFLFIKQWPVEGRYEPNWDSLDTRPLPAWFDNAKVGIFVHWGVFSVPSYGGEWFWIDWQGAKAEYYVKFMQANYGPRFAYQDFGPQFQAELFSPNQWANIFAQSGAKYVVLTSKHHEGFTLWPSKYSFGWNAMDVGPKRDLVGELATAVRKQNLTFGLYHSLYEWFHPLYLADKAMNFTKSDFVDKKMLPEMYELVTKYKPEVLWSDGDWEAKDIYFKSTQFLAWLYNESPVKDTIVVNDRWGMGIPCKHGDFFSCADRFNPGTLQEHKWENAMTIDKRSWGYRREAPLSDYLTSHELIKTLAETVSCGGNILINVGPTKDGMITPIFEERLLDLGRWLEINGEAIYESHPHTIQNDTFTSDVWYTSKPELNAVYAVILNWPKDDIIVLQPHLPYNIQETKTVLLGNENIPLKIYKEQIGVYIKFPNKAFVSNHLAWVLKFTRL